MPPKILVFTGAPASSSLDWSPSLLLNHLTEPIARFAAQPAQSSGSQDETPSLLQHAVWRLLPSERHEPYQDHDDNNNNNNDNNTSSPNPWRCFYTQEDSVSSILSDAESPHLFSQFCERSLAAHDGLPSSALDVISSSQDHQSSRFMSTTQFSSSYDTTESSASPLLGAAASPPRPVYAPAAPLSDLAELPSPAHLDAIQPQTMTVNLVVGIISIEPERQIRTRWGATRTLVEVVVGDHTRAGFSIAFWRDPRSAAPSPVAGLRRQDVVLLRNVALHSFRRKVHGQGLRRDLTKVHLLHRRLLDPHDDGGCYSAADLAACLRGREAHPQLQKACRVREWVVKFVGAAPPAPGRGKRKREPMPQAWDEPPPLDTQY